MRFLLPLLLLSVPALAQTAIPVGTPGVVIPAQTNSKTLRYQVQSSNGATGGYACVSWITASITITGTDGNAKCTGQGAFLVTAGAVATGSTDARVYPAPVPGTPMYGVAATGATLQVVFEAY